MPYPVARARVHSAPGLLQDERAAPTARFARRASDGIALRGPRDEAAYPAELQLPPWAAGPAPAAPQGRREPGPAAPRPPGEDLPSHDASAGPQARQRPTPAELPPRPASISPTHGRLHASAPRLLPSDPLKLPLPAAVYRDLMPSGVRLAYLIDDRRRLYLLSSTQDQGTYGKIRLGLRAGPTASSTEQADSWVCVKELRGRPPRLLPGKDRVFNRHRQMRTRVSEGIDVGREMALSYLLGGPFALQTAFPIGRADRHGRPKGTMLLSGLADRTLAGFAQALGARQRSALARLAAYCIGDSLACLHEQRLVHLDVKPDNILVRAQDCAVQLTDFGAVKLGWPLAYEHGWRGTFPPPELFVAPQRPTLDGRCDMWALGATLLMVLAPRAGYHLAFVPDANYSVDLQQTEAKLRLFTQAARGARGPGLELPAAYLEACYAVDAELTQLVLERLLTHVDERDCAAHFVGRIEPALFLQDGTPLAESVRQALMQVGPDRRRQAVMAGMQAVRARLSEMDVRLPVPLEPL